MQTLLSVAHQFWCIQAIDKMQFLSRDVIEGIYACRGAESGRVTDNPPPGFGVQADPFASPLKSDSVGSGVTEEGEIAAVLGRMLDQAGRMDAQALSQVWATKIQYVPINPKYRLLL